MLISKPNTPKIQNLLKILGDDKVMNENLTAGNIENSKYLPKPFARNLSRIKTGSK